MTDQAERQPYTPEMIPLSEGWSRSYLVSIESEMDPTGEDYHAGWMTIHSDAVNNTVTLDGGEELSPAEARNLSHALFLAAEHAEHYALTVANVLREEQMIDHLDTASLPIEHQRAINGWINARVAAAHRRLHASRVRAES
jgi:hypothetical protein